MIDMCSQDEMCGTSTPLCKKAMFACQEADIFEHRMKEFGIPTNTEVEKGRIIITMTLKPEKEDGMVQGVLE